MAGPFTTPVALSVPMENRVVRDNDFKALNVQEGLEEIDFRREQKEPTGFLDRSNSTIGADELTRTFTISPTGSEYVYYIRGERFVVTAPVSIQWTDTGGIWFFHFDDDENLIATQAGWDFEFPIAFIAVVYWDAINKKCVLFGEERHGLVMDWATHKRLHETEGTVVGPDQFVTYNLEIRQDGSQDSHAEFAITDGSLYDEDIKIDIVDTPTPSNPHEQILSPIAEVPVFYKEGTDANPNWRVTDATTAPLALDGGNAPFYNELNGGGNWQLTNVTQDYYIVQTICITNDLRYPVIALLSSMESQTIADLASNINFTEQFRGLPFTEITPVEFLFYQCSTSYTNSYNARLIEAKNIDDVNAVKDRYVATASYGGNAGNNRWLEYPGSADASDIQPLLVPDDSFIVTVTLQSTSTIAINKSIRFYDERDNSTLFTLVVPSGGEDSWTFDISEFIPKDTRISVRVLSGSISKPVVRFWLETINI